MSKKPRLDKDPAEGSRSVVDRELKRSSGKSGPEADAKGQSEKNHKGGTSDGVSSANPRAYPVMMMATPRSRISEKSRTPHG